MVRVRLRLESARRTGMRGMPSSSCTAVQPGTEQSVWGSSPTRESGEGGSGMSGGSGGGGSGGGATMLHCGGAPSLPQVRMRGGVSG